MTDLKRQKDNIQFINKLYLTTSDNNSKDLVISLNKNTIKKIRENISAKEIFASIGPCIGKKNYEVDQIFYRRFMSISKNNRFYFSKKNKLKKISILESMFMTNF